MGGTRADGSPPGSGLLVSPDVGWPFLLFGGPERDAGLQREGRWGRGGRAADRSPPARLSLAAHAGASTLEAAVRTAGDSVQTEETPAPAPWSGTHAGFMTAGSVLPGCASGAPGSSRRAGEGGGRRAGEGGGRRAEELVAEN